MDIFRAYLEPTVSPVSIWEYAESYISTDNSGILIFDPDPRCF